MNDVSAHRGGGADVQKPCGVSSSEVAETVAVRAAMDLQKEVEGLKKVLESLQEENGVLKRELSELRKMCTHGERIHQAEMSCLKNEVERLKKTQPDVASGVATGPSGSSSPDIYARVKGAKKRPQSMHEMSILPPNLQVQLQDKSSQNGSAHVFVGPVPPFYFTLDNFDHYKKNSLKWFSPPFYTHCFGYRMCIGVDAGGHSVGEGSHVSLLVYLLPGEHDENLNWPFRGTVKISLLNERRDGNHFESAVEFDEDTPLVNSAQVTESDRSTGWGNAMFIAHSKLGHDPSLDCEFLKYNRLRFAVKQIITS